ncbi:hypothetical protein K1719_006627 [Acacia pycnantha]|nr:hypothetical protein K1719_006627 [Acacia pycnantha]
MGCYKTLLEGLVKVTEENEKLLLKLGNRIGRSGSRFHFLIDFTDLSVSNTLMASLLAPQWPIELGSRNSKKKKHINILEDVSGIIKPARMMMLLDTPSSGKTALLLALVGKLKPKLKTKVYRDSMTDEGIYIGALFNGLPELTMMVTRLLVLRDFLFFPSWILKMPLMFMEVSAWVFLSYVIGFDPNARR